MWDAGVLWLNAYTDRVRFCCEGYHRIHLICIRQDLPTEMAEDLTPEWTSVPKPASKIQMHTLLSLILKTMNDRGHTKKRWDRWQDSFGQKSCSAQSSPAPMYRGQTYRWGQLNDRQLSRRSVSIIIRRSILYLTSVSHLGWPSRAMRLGGLGLNRTSP